jgi:putative flavoprotein involved in K+ transport
LSGLPGLPMPRSYGRYVARDHVVEYLERYAAHHRLRISLGTEVRRLDRTGDGWRLDVAAGPLFATYAVVATGHNSVPALPGWPGLDRFRGEIVHASTYRNPRPYAGRDVLVVGAGNSGAEIAVDLVEGGAARVRLAVRTPPNITDVRAPGLWFTGFTNPISGMLRELAIDARRIARAVSDSVAAAGTRSSVG